MAYPTVSAPYGLVPVQLIGGRVYAGSIRKIAIPSAYATDIFYGDVVKLAATGTIAKDTGTATATPVGSFLGCEYTNPSTKQKLFAQYWPANTVASDAMAIVADDPSILMKSAVVSGTTVIAAAGAAWIGANAALVQNTGSTTTGNSAVALGALATTNTLPVRIIDVIRDTAITTTATATTTSGSTSVTLSAANASILKFMDVAGSGIDLGTTVSAISGTSLTLSANATASATVTLTFTGYPEILVKWNAGMHQYDTATGV